MLFGCRPICTLLHVHMGARRGARVGAPFLENNFLLYEGLFFLGFSPYSLFTMWGLFAFFFSMWGLFVLMEAFLGEPSPPPLTKIYEGPHACTMYMYVFAVL